MATASADLHEEVSSKVDIHLLRQLQSQGDHERALEIAQSELAGRPFDRDFLLIQARALRHLSRIDEALVALERLGCVAPRFSLLHQERGFCHIARKDAPAAIHSLLTAVNINPALPLAWRMLEGVYRLTGDAESAGTAATHVATLEKLPLEVVKATSLFSDGDLEEAEAIIRAFLLANGDHPEGMRLLAKIGLASGVYDDAELLLSGVLAMVPDHRAAQFEYTQALAYRQKFTQAEQVLAPLLAQDWANRDYRVLASTIAVGLGRHDEAIAYYRAMLQGVDATPPDTDALKEAARAAELADLNLWLGHALKTIGHVNDGIAAYRAAAAARPDFGDAYWSLANLKSYRFTDQEVAQMEVAASSPSTTMIDQLHLCFALGKAFEDRSEIDRSWRWYERGNSLKHTESRYRPEVIETNTRLQRQTCTSAFFFEREGWGSADPDPIFIVGLPRAGSTLIEQILASHSKIEGTQELPNVQRIVQELQGRDSDLDNPRYPGVLKEMTDADFRELGARYLEETRPYRSGKPFFIDKMPNNFRHVGLIHLMLPNARIIDARREPMACCFSNFKQLFAQGQEFAYSLTDIARYYRTYVHLMEHWDDALPGRVLRVQHEELLDDLEGNVRRILDYCDLPFESGCLEFHQTRRSVRTPSSEQVRKPLYRDAVGHWEKYREWLAPLQSALNGDGPTFGTGTGLNPARTR